MLHSHRKHKINPDYYPFYPTVYLVLLLNSNLYKIIPHPRQLCLFFPFEHCIISLVVSRWHC